MKNYIKSILAFHRLVELNSLTTGQIALWYALMHINNKCGWPEWFTAPNRTLETHSGLSRPGILKARNRLKQLGLVEISPCGTSATRYKLCDMAESYQDSYQAGYQDSYQDSNTLYKQKMLSEPIVYKKANH